MVKMVVQFKNTRDSSVVLKLKLKWPEKKGSELGTSSSHAIIISYFNSGSGGYAAQIFGPCSSTLEDSSK